MKPIYAVPAILAIVYRAWSHKSLTPVGLVVAALTAVLHALHPWNLPFVLLGVFFLAGTRVTKVKKDVKEKLTIQSTGSAGEGPRTHIQVLANSGVATVLTLLSAYQLSQQPEGSDACTCYPWEGDLLIVGIIANYAAVAADTFSSELGILSTSPPRLITSPTLRVVPKGTNGGVTVWGLLAGLLGSLLIVTTAMFSLPLCGSPISGILRAHGETADNSIGSGKAWNVGRLFYFMFGLVICGALGSVLDSILGGLLQESVIDTRSGRVVEGDGGKKVIVTKLSSTTTPYLKKRAEIKAKLLSGDGKAAIPQPGNRNSSEDAIDAEGDENTTRTARYDPKKKMRQPSFGDGEPSRRVESGLGVLDNNEVNFLMALTMSLGAMALAGWAWGVPFTDAWHL